MFSFGKGHFPERIADPQQLRRLLRVLFVDDQEILKPEALRQHGYNVFQRKDINNLAEIENQEYHIIFCDVKGVGVTLSKEEGAGLIRIIREQVKYPIVIGFSGYKYTPGEPQEQAMRQHSHEIIGKDDDLDRYIDVIQRWGKTVFSTQRCVDLIAAEAQLSTDRVAKFVRKQEKGADWATAFEKVGKVTSAVKVLLDILQLIGAVGKHST